MSRIVLVSQSPRRRELLQQIGADFVVRATRIDEVMDNDLPLHQRLEKLAKEKAEALSNYNYDDFIVGADTVVVLDDEIIGKAKDREDAKRILMQLSGKTHRVITAVAIIYDRKVKTFCSEANVTFYSLSDEEIERYLDTEDWTDKAGAYAIQSIGAILVERIEGDYNTVVGLPVARLLREIESF